MVGTTISHYRILEKLGEGGMGVVYKAHDTKLDRIVALKFLPPPLSASEQDKERFIQEAKAAAALNHPNICTIHDVEEHGDQQFIVMEFVDGVTMRKKFERTPLTVSDAVAHAIQIGEALQEAHSKSVVHRDIKSDNIMVNSKNQVKVMDFGLAKLKGSLKLTRTSSTVGTLAYMAPEQIQGGEVDSRSDIFSLGVVLFEMLTGRLPFRGEHEAAMMYSIVNEEPEQLTRYVQDASPELLHILGRALEKDPADRYQSVADMVIDLRRLKRESSRVSRTLVPQQMTVETSAHKAQVDTSSTPVVPPRTRRPQFTIAGVILLVGMFAVGAYFFLMREGEPGDRLPIAVADFLNQTNEPELDGLSGMLITSMEQSRRLAVLTRSRMFDLLKQMGMGDVDRIDESIGRQICTHAGVSALVTASIRKFGRLYTIDLKVLDPGKNEYLFTAKEEGEGQENIPAMLDRLSEKARIGLKEKAAEVRAANQKVADVTTTNLEAYRYYFQGEELINKLKFEEAQTALRKAIELDTTFGLAYYRLAYAIAWNTGAEQLARDPIRRAMNYRDRMPERTRYLVRSENARIEQGMEAALPILKEMQQRYPDDKEMLFNIGDFSYHLGDIATASEFLSKVVSIDPTFERALQHLVWTYRDLSEYTDMLDVAKRYAAVAGSAESYRLLADAYTLTGQMEAGVSTLRSARELFPQEYEITTSIATLLRVAGRPLDAERELKLLTENSQPPTARRAGFASLGEHYAYLGRYREALRARDRSIELARELKDTTQLAISYLERGFATLAARRDPGAAWKEVEKSFPLQRSIRGASYWGPLSWISVLCGNYVMADTLTRDRPGWWRLGIQSGTRSMQGNCAEALLLADTIAQLVAPVRVRIGVHFKLAECQYNAGLFDQALTSMNIVHGEREFVSHTEYPPSIYLLGKIYEKKGDLKSAIANYEKFVDLWKNADKDLHDYIDARARLARLKELAAK